LGAALLLFAGTALGRPTNGYITPNFENADFARLVEAVSVATGKSFIIHPRVRARVTMLASKEMSPVAFYDAFLSLVSVCGFVAVPDGGIVVILPHASAPTLITVGLSDFTGVSCVRE
jgi:general secretion pathway protein D